MKSSREKIKSTSAEIVREGVAACAELILADSALVTATKTESPQKIKKETKSSILNDFVGFFYLFNSHGV